MMIRPALHRLDELQHGQVAQAAIAQPRGFRAPGVIAQPGDERIAAPPGMVRTLTSTSDLGTPLGSPVVAGATTWAQVRTRRPSRMSPLPMGRSSASRTAT